MKNPYDLILGDHRNRDQGSKSRLKVRYEVGIAFNQLSFVLHLDEDTGSPVDDIFFKYDIQRENLPYFERFNFNSKGISYGDGSAVGIDRVNRNPVKGDNVKDFICE